MEGWLAETLRLTAALLVAGFALILPGTLGVGGSLALALGLTAVALALVAVQEQAGAVGSVGGWDVGHYLRVLWVGPILAAVIVLLALDASPGEIQALGGIVGLLGMANYFLRPVYQVAVAGGRVLTRLGQG